MSVTREHMALFLTRLAVRVEIELAADPPDAGFTDIGDLSAESQTAINQLADLDITMGTGDGTTYSPAGSVTRGQMALFIARLMDEMTAVSDGDAENDAEGSLPKDVKDGKTPFADLGRTTKEAYDAITALWELGVASGISDTSYAPSASITRSSMADFMAGVLDHSNARPAGLSIQLAKDSGFDDTNVVMMVSVRDDDFAPVEDALVDVFNSTSGDAAFDDDGKCATAPADAVVGDCQWNSSDEPTDGDGNLFDTATTDQDPAKASNTRIFYAWMGDDDTSEFDKDDVDYVSASLTAYTVEAAILVESDVNELASRDSSANNAPMVHLGRTSSVTYTVQLRTAATDGHDVARSGVKFTVKVSKGPDSVVTTTHETDADGKVTFSVEGPDDDPDNEPDADNENASEDDRDDTITITYHGGETTLTEPSKTEQIHWREAPSEVVTATAKAGSSYVVVEADKDAKVSGSVTFYDQYGAPHRQARGQLAGINFTGNENTVDGSNLGASTGHASVRSNGTATRSVTLKGQVAGTQIVVAFVWNPNESSVDSDKSDVRLSTDFPASIEPVNIQVVNVADAGSTGSRDVFALFADDDEFLAEANADRAAGTATLLFSYDSSDTFTDTNGKITMEKFEELIGTDAVEVVDVVSYDPDGDSIFQVVPA